MCRYISFHKTKLIHATHAYVYALYYFSILLYFFNPGHRPLTGLISLPEGIKTHSLEDPVLDNL